MGTIVVHPDTPEKLTALKDFLKEADISYEEENPLYSPEFVKKIKRSQTDFEEGRFTVIDPKDLWK